MSEYKLEVTTGDIHYAGTLDYIYVTLFGTKGHSERTTLDNYGIDFTPGKKGTYTIKVGSSLGTLLLIKVEKAPFAFLPEDEWYCSKIVVTTPEGEAILFPCYRWVSSGELVELRGGKATKVFEDDHPLLKDHRKKELTFKKNVFQWKITNDGMPHFLSLNEPEFPAEIRLSKSRLSEMNQELLMTAFELLVKRMAGSAENWKSIEEMKKVFWYKKTPMSEYVTEHWKEDEFYGYEFLNGVNPALITCCSELPTNFPVTEEMVKPFLENGSSLKTEMTKGKIFLYEQSKLDGISPRTYNGEPLHVTPGLCLFYLNPENKLMPIAIQLYQQPSEQNPIFLPSDSESDWLLAKMFIKNADSMDHQGVHHLLKTHLLAEVFAVATFRNFPVIHPIYKLLIPHFQCTMHINFKAREILLGPKDPQSGIQTSSLGLEGIQELMKRSHAKTTYSSLCLPENITARGLESIPNFYYRDDGLKLWNIIKSFVKAIVEYYYPSDSEVCKDSELQEWVRETFVHGFFGNKASGFPENFYTVEEVIKFITMVIFSVSAQHAAVNNGQFDYNSFIPNRPLLLRKPPPTTKGQSSMKTVLDTLPNVGETVTMTVTVWVLTRKYSDAVTLGMYPDESFNEAAPKQMIREFQAKLSDLSESITLRNSQLQAPYTYLDPAQIENSITI